jgi:hypothetical protein
MAWLMQPALHVARIEFNSLSESLGQLAGTVLTQTKVITNQLGKGTSHFLNAPAGGSTHL